MNWDEYNILFHKLHLNTVAFKRLMECDKEVLTLVNAAIEAKRSWVGLTQEEVSKIIDDEIGFNCCWGPEEAFAAAIEAKLKEKNTWTADSITLHSSTL